MRCEEEAELVPVLVQRQGHDAHRGGDVILRTSPLSVHILISHDELACCR